MTPSRIALALLTAGLMAGVAPPPAAHAADELVLSGRAQTGADARDVRFTFGCTPKSGANFTGVLSVVLTVPEYEQLSPVFPFETFEGPDADAGKLTSLEATGAGSPARDIFEVAGSAGIDADKPFNFELDAAMRGEVLRLRAVAKVLRRLVAGPGQLVWRQANPHPGGVALVATLPVTPADAARLQSLLGPCLAVAGRGG